MIVYLITIVLVFIFGYIANTLSKIKLVNNHYYREYNRFFVFLTAACLIFVSGFRWRVGTDYWDYSESYVMYKTTVWNDLFSYNEPGIKLIAWISSYICDDYATMFFITSLITLALFVSTISKYSKMFLISILLFIFIGSWHGSFNGIRQYLACAIIFSGHRYIVNRKFFKYILVVFVAGLCHFSALSMVLLYFVPRKRLNIKHLFIMGIATLAIVYSYGFIFELIESYKGSFEANQYTQEEVSVFRILTSFAPLFLYLALTEKKKLNNEDFFYINMLFINASVVLATSQSAYLARFVIYTKVFSILGLPRLLNMKDKYLLFLMQMIIIILYSVFWYIEVSKTSNLINFQWIFERS
ncbi:EpsG family protein [Priestia endophytica]|uniref:EpsG family protein n=1 Tax=Priestia endophytica TaxID=135735 RepID=UPI000DCA9649|nr:EpsG family protein [Priestia endophytica]RAS79921.1 hypothetical protein A4U60_14660 [Priestia endophytica]